MSNDRLGTLAGRVLQHSVEMPGERAIACDGRSLTFEALATRARACAARIVALGCQPGGDRRVGILSSNSLDFAIVVTACQSAGVTVVPLPGLVAPDALSRMMADANVALLFYDEHHAGKADAALSHVQQGSAISRFMIGTENAIDSIFERWLSDAGPVDLDSVAADPGWVSDLIYSSGTTGTPKGITQTYASRTAQCVSLGPLGVARGTRFLQTIGLYSNMGLSGLLLSLWWGSTFFIMRKFAAGTAAGLLAREAIDVAWFAPATLIRTVEAAGSGLVHDKPCVKLCAGAPLGIAQKQQILDDWPGPFYDVYGQTETGSLTLHAMHASPPEKLGSVGKVLPNVSVRIIDDDGNLAGVNQEGEIAGHSATLMSGYHQRDDANASAFWRDEDDRLYIRTGDVGRLDADGYLWLCDRKKDMIISGGFNVYPADIERVLADHPAVFEVAVVGCASMRWGETPVAFLTLRKGFEADPEDLRSWANARLGAVQRLAMVKILEALPNGTLGKILKRALRDTHGKALGTLP